MPSPLSTAVDLALSAHEAAPRARTAAHLADAAFRFDGPAPPTPTPRPGADVPGASWTLAQTLQELRLRQVRVVRTTRGLRVIHAHRLPSLAEAVRAHVPEVGLWLDLGRPAPEHGWDDETALRHAWLLAHPGVPPTPLALRPGLRITDWPRFVASVEGRYAAGPAVAGADGLRRDLADLYAQQARHLSMPVVARVAARAA